MTAYLKHNNDRRTFLRIHCKWEDKKTMEEIIFRIPFTVWKTQQRQTLSNLTHACSKFTGKHVLVIIFIKKFDELFMRPAIWTHTQLSFYAQIKNQMHSSRAEP